MPHLDFVSSGCFKFPENDFNISPLSKQSKAFKANLITVSLTSVSAVVDLDRETVTNCLKALFVRFVEMGRRGVYTCLDLKIG